MGDTPMPTIGDASMFEATTVAPDDFRRVMGTFVTGATVVAIADPTGRPYGFSVNAFTSVSLHPPEVLVCIDRKVTGHQYFKIGKIFSVHILAVHQRNLCQNFVTKGIDRFQGLSVGCTPRGAPLIGNVLSVLECRVVNVFAASDHDIFLSAVQWCAATEGAPLIFHKGRFARIEPLLESTGQR
jgi:flavin reductase (DIM6/NTAB) family NADH-FMN oxidoreductase RutF